MLALDPARRQLEILTQIAPQTSAGTPPLGWKGAALAAWGEIVDFFEDAEGEEPLLVSEGVKLGDSTFRRFLLLQWNGPSASVRATTEIRLARVRSDCGTAPE